MIFALLIALFVVDDRGIAVQQAQVDFVSTSGEHARTVTDARGGAQPPLNFHAARATVEAAGYFARTVDLSGAADQRVVVQRAIPLIASIRTTRTQSLHTLPIAASVLDKTQIALSSAQTADELMRELPGFDRTRSNSMFTNYGQLRISLTGAGNDRGLMFADGVPAQDGFGGQVDWAAYPAQSIQHVQLIEGGASALYGSGAIGGVLSMQTLAPAPGQPASGFLRVTAGTHDYGSQMLALQWPVASRLDASLVANAQRMSYNDLPPNYHSDVDRTADSTEKMTALRMRYALSASDSISVGQLGAWDSQAEGRPNYNFSRRLSQTMMQAAHTTPNSNLELQSYARSAFIENIADHFPSQPGTLLYTQDVPTSESGLSMLWSVLQSDSEFAARLDERHIAGQVSQFYPTGALQSRAAGTQDLGGFALQETWRSQRAELLTGARWDFHEAVSPRLAARFDLSQTLTLRASTGSGFRAPYLNELLRGYVIAGVFYEPNPLLVPERSETNSLGLDAASARQRLSLDIFDTAVHDAIMFETIDAKHQMRSNVARTQTDGYAVTYLRITGTCSQLHASFTSQNPRVTAGPAPIVGNTLPYVPKTSASASYDGRIGDVSAGVSVSYLGQIYADDLNAQPLGSATLVGLHARIPVAGASIDLNADNATGATYLSSIDRYGPPAVFSIGYTLPIGGRAAHDCSP